MYGGEIWLDSPTTAAVMQFASSSDARPFAPVNKFNKQPLVSRREHEIIQLVTQGLKNKEIAERFLISEQTVKNHLHNIFDKLGVSDRLGLALYAIHNGLYSTTAVAARLIHKSTIKHKGVIKRRVCSENPLALRFLAEFRRSHIEPSSVNSARFRS